MLLSVLEMYCYLMSPEQCSLTGGAMLSVAVHLELNQRNIGIATPDPPLLMAVIPINSTFKNIASLEYKGSIV